MYLKILQNFAVLVAFQNSGEENKIEFLEGQFHDESFPLPTKRKLSFLLNFLNNLQ